MATCTTTTIVAGSSLTVTAEFFDEDGVAATPSSVGYTVHCLTNGSTINASGTAAAASAVEIDITSAENALIDASNEKEKRRVVVTAAYSGGKQHVETLDYYVRAQA